MSYDEALAKDVAARMLYGGPCVLCGKTAEGHYWTPFVMTSSGGKPVGHRSVCDHCALVLRFARPEAPE
jgi:hypothetical protein